MLVTLFSKPDCQLCDALKFELTDLQSEYNFALREEFVKADALEDREVEPHVPYVDIDRDDGSTLRFDFPVKQTELRRVIHSEFRRHTGLER